MTSQFTKDKTDDFIIGLPEKGKGYLALDLTILMQEHQQHPSSAIAWAREQGYTPTIKMCIYGSLRDGDARLHTLLVLKEDIDKQWFDDENNEALDRFLESTYDRFGGQCVICRSRPLVTPPQPDCEPATVA